MSLNNSALASSGCLQSCVPTHSRLLSIYIYRVHLLLLDKYAVRFIPHENGIHTIDVKFNGSHVVGSPFKVRVGEPGQAGNPALVSAYGAGLETGTTGKKHCFPCYLSSALWESWSRYL